MTKTPSIKTVDVAPYATLDLHQLEAKINELGQLPPSSETKAALRAIRQAIRARQRQIKAQVMEFEQTNDHHLLVFDSTDNFSKIAGRSVLFYAQTLADRIHRRYSVKNDTDGYFRSEEGIVSVRALNQLTQQLADINIRPDPELSTSELHFYTLPRIYTDEQIAKLRDRAERDAARVAAMIAPVSPLPELYALLLELNRLLYQNCKRISDTLARETLAKPLITEANELLVSYLNFANAKSTTGIARRKLGTTYTTSITQPPSIRHENLLNLLLGVRAIRNNLANIDNLHLVHQRELYAILEKLAEIERLTGREYTKLLHQNGTRKEAV